MGIKPMLKEFPQEKKASGGQLVTQSCHLCAFYREVELESRRLRRLCMMSGEKNPQAGMAGCHFLQGNRILLAKSRVSGNTSAPNYTRQGDAFSGKTGLKIAKKDVFSIDDFFGKPINHIQRKRKGSLARPGSREAPAARIAGERV